MCGIIGIIGEKNLGVNLFSGLMSLQHRGQDASGIVISNGDSFSVVKKTGLVEQALPIKEIGKLQGNIGIGHTRYSTIGYASNTNCQPLALEAEQKIAIAHNGNITNYLSLKNDLINKGIFLSTTIDLEPVLHIFAATYQKTGDFFSAVKQVMQEVKGAYSVVGVIANKGLFAFRDPHGIRPLVLGSKDGNYIVASESVALQVLKYNFERDILPGEAVFIDEKNHSLISKVVEERKTAHCMFEWIYFARTDSMIEQRSVYKARRALGKLLAEKLKGEIIDVVIPVPDTARTCAETMASSLGIAYEEGLIKNRYIGRTFIMPSQENRDAAVDIKLNPIISVVKDKNVAVVDDSIVRATTSRKIVRLLREAGAKKVIFVSSCPPIKNPCYYGIDMPTEQELIANTKTVEKIASYISADKVIYADVEDLQKAIDRELCTACLTGNYPVEVSSESKTFFSQDKKQR